MYYASQVVHPQPGYLTPRRWPRYFVHVYACVIAQKPKKTVIIPGRGSALNAGGMTVFAGVELAVGEEVTVAFNPPPPFSAESLTFRCVVRNRKGYTYGVEFLQNADNAHNPLARMGCILDVMEKTIGPLKAPMQTAAEPMNPIPNASAD